MDEPLILTTAPIPRGARELLGELGAVRVCRGALIDEVADADVLIVRGEPVDADCIAAGVRLRAIARTGSGVDNVDVEAATARGIPVLRVPRAGATPVAEGTWALILAAAKRLGELRACMDEDRWDERYAIEAIDLHGATLGVVGLGAVGREVARLGAAFGMHVVGFDPMLGDGDGLPVPIERTGLRELLERADVVTLHCELNASTRGLIDRTALRAATRAPVFVNAARGGVLDGDELLLEALEEGWISAAGLDVYAHEPLAPESPLLRDPRVVCTPHAIGLTRGWNERVFTTLRDELRTVLAGGVPAYLVNGELPLARQLGGEVEA